MRNQNKVRSHYLSNDEILGILNKNFLPDDEIIGITWVGTTKQTPGHWQIDDAEAFTNWYVTVNFWND